jgi:uncharacterized protein YqgV (UPF0045/DUF77 family)
MPNCNLSIQVLPFVKEDDLFPVVDKAIAVIQASGLPYQVGPLETTIEGDMDQLMDLARQVQQACIDAGVERLMTVIKVSYCAKGESMDEKTEKYR